MSGTNLTTCPKCDSLARRSRPNWWQRLFSPQKIRYRCKCCGKYFWRGG